MKIEKRSTYLRRFSVAILVYSLVLIGMLELIRHWPGLLWGGFISFIITIAVALACCHINAFLRDFLYTVQHSFSPRQGFTGWIEGSYTGDDDPEDRKNQWFFVRGGQHVFTIIETARKTPFHVYDPLIGATYTGFFTLESALKFCHAKFHSPLTIEPILNEAAA